MYLQSTCVLIAQANAIRMVALGTRRWHPAIWTWIAIFAIWNLQPAISFAQTGDCPRSLGEAYLDAGNVRARILNTGGLFYRGEPHVYEVPKGSGSNAIYAAKVWIAGIMNGEVRATAGPIWSPELWAGPLDEAGNPPAECSVYDRIWEIRREDIEAFHATGAVSDNLHDWPWHLGAPVVDGDGNPYNYDLAAGDLPELLGDQRLWTIMNDRGNVHERTGSEPIGIEVHFSAYAFTNPGPIGNLTFYKYRLINKNVLPFEQAYFGVFVDPDLGDFDDDYIGSDSLLHLGYVYNADNEDVSGEGYGTLPPALGFTFLESAVADADGLDNNRDGEIDEPGERIGLSSFMMPGDGGGPNQTPESARDHYYYLQARWKDGSRLLKGGPGISSSGHPNWFPSHLPKTPAKFFYSGNPVTHSFWSEYNLDDRGEISTPGDRRFLVSSGPFTLLPGESQDIVFAIIWSLGQDHLDSIKHLKKDAAAVRSSAEFFLSPTRIFPESPEEIHVLGFDQNFPNPFTESTTIRYSLPESLPVRLAVYDVLGREIKMLVDANQEEGIYTIDFDGSRLPAGIYYARIEMGSLRFTKKMVLAR